MIKTFLFLILAFSLSACSTIYSSTTPEEYEKIAAAQSRQSKQQWLEARQAELQDYFILHPELTESKKTRIVYKNISVGMEKHEIEASRGQPTRKILSSHGDTWVYGNTYVGFDTNDTVRSWTSY